MNNGFMCRSYILVFYGLTQIQRVSHLVILTTVFYDLTQIQSKVKYIIMNFVFYDLIKRHILCLFFFD